jgi:hypothetical protein
MTQSVIRTSMTCTVLGMWFKQSSNVLCMYAQNTVIVRNVKYTVLC